MCNKKFCFVHASPACLCSTLPQVFAACTVTHNSQKMGRLRKTLPVPVACTHCQGQILKVVMLADIQPAVSQKPAPVAKPLPISTKCLNDVLDIFPRCQSVGGFSDITSPRCAHSSRIRRSLKLGRQSQGSPLMLPDIPLGRHRRQDIV